MDDIQQALLEYFMEWNTWSAGTDFFDFRKLKPMHAGWKVADEIALGKEIARLLPFTEQGHIGTVDNRKIVLLALKQPVESVPVLQVMQLRPNSVDPLGLDHVAFYCKDMPALERALKKLKNKWEHQSNPGHIWISLWFGKHEREVKFFDHTSLDLGARELSEASSKIKSD